MNSTFKKTALALAMAAAFGAASAAEVDTKGGIKVKSDDGQFVGELNGRMHYDAYFFQNDDDSTIENDNGDDFRRLRLSAKGTMYGVYEGKIELDFRTNRANGEASSTVMRDVWLAYSGFEAGKLTLGHQKVPMGLDELTSSNYIWFIERAAPVSIVTDGAHRRGLQFSGQRGNWTYAAMGYDTNNRNSTSGVDSAAGFGLGGRVTWSPIKDKTQVLHLGLSAAKEVDIQGLGDRSTRYEANLADSITLVDVTNPGTTSLLLDDDEMTKLGVEIAYVNGPFSTQAEYIAANIDSSTAGDPEFGGYYVAASYFLTGETRPYRASNGTFDRIKPNDKRGAWEVVGRYSTVQGEGDLATPNQVEREIKNVTLGVNYYINPQIRLMANLMQADVDAGTTEGKPRTLALRAQFDF